MVDDDKETDYRPAQTRDFTRAITNVDATDLRPADATGAPMPPVVHPAPMPTSTRVEERIVDETPPARPFSLAAGFFGWSVAAFFTLLLSTLVLAFVGSAAFDATDAGTTDLTTETWNDLTTVGTMGLLISLFVAYLLGGYAAGRIGLWHGTGHGLAVVAWTVLFALVTVGLTAAYGSTVADLYVTPTIEWSDLTGAAVVGLLVALAAMLAGAVLGANLGTRPNATEGVLDRRGLGRVRGRPL